MNAKAPEIKPAKYTRVSVLLTVVCAVAVGSNAMVPTTSQAESWHTLFETTGEVYEYPSFADLLADTNRTSHTLPPTLGVGWDGIASDGDIWTLLFETTSDVYEFPSFADLLADTNRTTNTYAQGVGWDGIAAAVPEPSILVLASMGGLGFAAYGWRRRKRTAT